MIPFYAEHITLEEKAGEEVGRDTAEQLTVKNDQIENTEKLVG